MEINQMMYDVFDKLDSLPVSSLLQDISKHVRDGGISIINSETGSGKSLLIPLRIQLDTQEQVIVLEPRRFLAINAPENLASISETILGEEFGYLVGHSSSDDENLFDHQKTMVGFVTYGYALATKMIMEADHIIFDEIHEHSIDMAICKALIKYRYKNGNPPKSVLLMSASLDAEAESAYWNDVSFVKVFSAGNGRKFNCKKVHLPATKPAEAALSLIDDGYKGVLVFAPGVGEIQDIIDDFYKLATPEKYPSLIVESIHGQVEYLQRRAALESPPEGYAKILVGTNVIESGMSLPWVDSGVTTGDKKELHVRSASGAVVLTKVELVKSNVDQQSGRTNRFCDSKFIICGPLNYDQMKAATTPEIERLPLSALYMHCQSVDIDPNELEFLPQPRPDKMKEAAKQLMNLGFFDKNMKFTHAGIFAQNLPVGLETAALLYHAECKNILANAIPLAAVYEVGSLRKDHNFSHGFHRASDVMDGVYAYMKAVEIQSHPTYSRQDRSELMEHHNIGHKKFLDAVQVVKSLERKFGVKTKWDLYNQNDVNDLMECILAASVCTMGTLRMGMKGPAFAPAGSLFDYSVSRGSVIDSAYTTLPGAAKLRVITPRNGQAPFTVAENVTQFSLDLIEKFSQIREDVFTKVADMDGDVYLVNGVRYYFKRIDRSYFKEVPPPSAYTNIPSRQRRDNNVISFGGSESPKQEGTMAELMRMAMEKKRNKG